MTCNEFDAIVVDLARGGLIEVRDQSEAEQHARACAGCARKLSDEANLTAGLRELARVDAGVSAPAGVEVALTRALGELETRRRVSSSTLRALRIASVAAVVVLAVSGVAAWFVMEDRQVIRRDDSPGVETRKAAPSESPKSDEEKTGSPGDVEARPDRATDEPRSLRKLRASSRIPKSPVESAEDDDDIMTGFFPLVSDREVLPTEGGHLVRVEMPRTALAAFGLPMNVERASEPVEADVLFGYDGVARAIRFKQQTGESAR